MLLQVFQLFCTNVASVSFKCFKSSLRCCTCCKVTHLPQLPAAAAWASCMHVGGAEGWDRYSEAGAGSGERWQQVNRQSSRGMRVRQAEGAGGKRKGCGWIEARSGGAVPGSSRRRRQVQKRTATTGVRMRASVQTSGC
jgi:hypothetical protein